VRLVGYLKRNYEAYSRFC